jgi:hypothetical protein
MSSASISFTTYRKSSTKKKRKTNSTKKKTTPSSGKVESVPFSCTSPTCILSGVDFEVGDVILIKNGIYKINSTSSIVFQRFSETTAEGMCLFYIQEDGEFLINRAVEVEDLSTFKLDGWKLTVHTDVSTQQEYLKFEKI